MPARSSRSGSGGGAGEPGVRIREDGCGGNCSCARGDRGAGDVRHDDEADADADDEAEADADDDDEYACGAARPLRREPRDSEGK